MIQVGDGIRYSFLCFLASTSFFFDRGERVGDEDDESNATSCTVNSRASGRKMSGTVAVFDRPISLLRSLYSSTVRVRSDDGTGEAAEDRSERGTPDRSGTWAYHRLPKLGPPVAAECAHRVAQTPRLPSGGPK